MSRDLSRHVDNPASIAIELPDDEVAVVRIARGMFQKLKHLGYDARHRQTSLLFVGARARTGFDLPLTVLMSAGDNRNA